MTDINIAELRRRWNGPRQFIVCEKLQMLALLDEIEQLREEIMVMTNTASEQYLEIKQLRAAVQGTLHDTRQLARIEELEKALWKGIRWTRKALEYEPDWLGEARASLEEK